MKRPSWHPWGKWALFGALAGAAAIVMGSDQEHGAANIGHAKVQPVVAAPPRIAESIKQPPLVAKVEFERLLRQKPQSGVDVEIGNVFNTVSWYVPPPVPVLPPAPPPEPTAPPLPFTFLGHYKNPDSSAQVIILAWVDRVYTVSEGDVIDGTYRIGPAAAGLLEIIYLPLNIKQSLKLDGMS